MPEQPAGVFAVQHVDSRAGLDPVRIRGGDGVLRILPAEAFDPISNKAETLHTFGEVAQAVAGFYIEQTPTDGIPYWDTAPG